MDDSFEAEVTKRQEAIVERLSELVSREWDGLDSTDLLLMNTAVLTKEIATLNVMIERIYLKVLREDITNAQ